MELLVKRLNNYRFLEDMDLSLKDASVITANGRSVWEDIREASTLLSDYSTELKDLRDENEELKWQLAEVRDQQERMEEIASSNVDTAEDIFYAQQEIKEAHQKLEIQQEELTRLSITDPLTNLFNRRYLIDYLSNVDPNESPILAFLMLDLDRFKTVNDTYGHEAGDQALKAFAEIGLANIPQDAILGRLGGEEFGIILPGKNCDQAAEIAHNIRKNVKDNILKYGDVRYSITISIGVAEWAHQDVSIKDLLQRADNALYEAKNTGRNRVVVSDLPVEKS